MPTQLFVGPNAPSGKNTIVLRSSLTGCLPFGWPRMLPSAPMSPPEPTTPLWERRYRASSVTFPAWSRRAPDRVVYTSDESGSFQVHTWDVETGEHRRVSDDPVGVIYATATADG